MIAVTRTKTRWNSIESEGNEIVDENKALIFNWKGTGNVSLIHDSDQFCLHKLQRLNVGLFSQKTICTGKMYLDGGSRGEAG